MEMVAVHDRFGQSGKPAELMAAFGLKESHVVAAIERVIQRRRAGQGGMRVPGHARFTAPGAAELPSTQLAPSGPRDLETPGLVVDGLRHAPPTLLVREQEWALQHRRHVTDAHSSWLAGRTPAERLVLGLRTGVSQIESRRIGGPVGRRPAPNAAAAPRAAPASSP